MGRARAEMQNRVRGIDHAMHETRLETRVLAVIALASTAAWAPAACTDSANGRERSEPLIAAEQVADMLHAVMEADRTAYTKQVINRLTKEQKVKILHPERGEPEALRASEQWRNEHGTLPLPAQMFRMGAEAVGEKDAGFSYALLSKWPINKQNESKTEMETKGLAAVVQNRGSQPFYGTEKLGDQTYFTAVYADVAIAPACVECHNSHQDSPRNDFKIGDVMGGVVVRIPIGG